MSIQPKQNLRIFGKVFGFYALYLFLSALMAGPVIGLEIVMHVKNKEIVTRAAPFTGAVAAIVTTLCFLAISKQSIKSIGLTCDGKFVFDTMKGILVSGLALLLIVAMMFCLNGVRLVYNQQNSFATLAFWLVLFLFVAINEEVVFRGYPFQLLLDNFSKWKILVPIAVVFSVAHLSNLGIKNASVSLKIITMANIGLAGVVFGLFYIETKSLAMPIGLHLGWNYIQGSVLGFNVSGVQINKSLWVPIHHSKHDWITGGTVGVEGSLICLAVYVFAILIFAKRQISTHKQNQTHYV